MKTLPLEYKNRMQEILKEDFLSYIEELEKPPVKAFRVNTDKISLKDFEKLNTFSSAPVPYIDNAFYLEYEKIGNHPYHHAGLIYVQEPAAMAPAECIDINPDWFILDMCAAPGGKSTQLKNKLSENGVLVSNEIIPSRCKILTGNIERLGLQNTVTTCMDSAKLANCFPNTFDLVMVDAPCSGEGMFRKEEAAISEWSQSNVLMCAKRQSEILDNAVLTLKPGGYIIYATCTFSLEENEMTLDAFLSRHSEFEILPVNEKIIKHTSDGISFDGAISKSLHFARRFYPHINNGEGQFMALLHHTGENKCDIAHKNTSSAADSLVTEFLDDVLIEYNRNFVTTYNGNPVYYNQNLPIKDGQAFSCGVTIGEIRKDRLMPHHQFFTAMGKNFKRKINLTLDHPNLNKYLHGEEIDTSCENGWAVVLVDGYALGGAKVVNGKAKNHYPKGLRK